MKIIVPGYYKNFACIAGRCRHSCCIGWEIDIDEDTLEMYNSLPGETGDRIRGGIVYRDPPCFRLREGDRCHFLNERGLCDIILTLGEDGLCDICADHPRFRNYFSDRCEMGLGLCCEEACRLILGDREDFTLEILDDDGEDEGITTDEEEFFRIRDGIFRQVGDMRVPFSEILKDSGQGFDSPHRWAEFYRSLERLDPVWDKYLDILESVDEFSVPENRYTEAGNLYRYFIYRHGGDCTEKLAAATDFAAHATQLILTLAHAVNADFEGICEICRIYSSEIEYSEENTEAVISALK